MKIIRQKEFEENIDEYLDYVGEKKEQIMIILEDGKTVYLKPVSGDAAN